jgi:hypothetical protein
MKYANLLQQVSQIPILMFLQMAVSVLAYGIRQHVKDIMFVPRWGLLLCMAVILLIVVITTTVVLFNGDNTKPSKLYDLHNFCKQWNTELTDPSESREGVNL